ncbi:MAG TPA: hypothetical protein VJW20_11715 [Candidatus Angelobacter sp.]|nr:hypothetical protein [Candidatus Angelobacter sp.]
MSFGEDIFSFLTVWELGWVIDRKPCCAYLPANAGSRIIRAAIQKTAQIKKFLVSTMLVSIVASVVSHTQIKKARKQPSWTLFNINNLVG